MSLDDVDLFIWNFLPILIARSADRCISFSHVRDCFVYLLTQEIPLPENPILH